jgi:hypothetical protein
MRALVSFAIGAALLALVAPFSPTVAQQKTVKACQEEWRANKAANQAKGITEKSYVEQCRTGAATAQPAQPAPTPAATPAPAAPTAPKAAAPAQPAAAPPPAAKSAPTGTDQFTTEAQAKGRCPSDTVVWVNLKSNIYHFAGTKNYGNTKSGAYMCEKDTASQGMRAAKDEKHP